MEQEKRNGSLKKIRGGRSNRKNGASASASRRLRGRARARRKKNGPTLLTEGEPNQEESTTKKEIQSHFLRLIVEGNTSLWKTMEAAKVT